MVNITCKTLKQEVHNLDVNIDITIGDLKQELSQFGFNASEIKLIFKGRILEDSNTLATYNYNPESKDFIVIMAAKKQVELPKATVQPPSHEVHDDTNNDNDEYEDIEDENPNLNQNSNQNIANMLSQNPNVLLSLFAQHPEMSQLMNQYPNEIQQLISNPNFMQTVMSMGSQGAFGDNPNVLQINITEDERADINELMSLGFTENEVIQVYFACNKNKEQSAAMLFEDDNT